MTKRAYMVQQNNTYSFYNTKTAMSNILNFLLYYIFLPRTWYKVEKPWVTKRALVTVANVGCRVSESRSTSNDDDGDTQ